jgi:hypothetical protein
MSILAAAEPLTADDRPEWLPYVSDVGTLRPSEHAALTIARNLARDGERIGPGLSGRLVAIIDRLAGITESGEPGDTP